MAHITIAVSEQTFRDSFELLRDSVRFEEQDTFQANPYIQVEYDVKGHLAGGTLNLLGSNSIEIKELDLRWDRFKITLRIDIPTQYVGGWCIGGFGWSFCVPKVPFFSKSTDVEVKEDVAQFLSQELSLSCHLDARHYDASGPAPSPPCSLLRFVPWPSRDQWEIYVDPDGQPDVDLFDLGQIGSDIFRNALTDKIEDLIPNDLIGALLLSQVKGLANLIGKILDVPDDLTEAVSKWLHNAGLDKRLMTQLLDSFAKCNPIYGIDDPYQILPASDGLVPVRIPVKDVSVTTTDHEMIATATVGE
ncbi:MAG TPA: hypothetical protein VJ978_13050 [Nitriliruptoraceae bacterium]|nr:hypothetical protein [Nitriliruptoraceae bacterium]